ncbi:MAG: SRPBCC family protein [Asticcacaulis sp.]|uniref:SRPBCC family protein n=1 Tax=Asticcacaulis sp. TaxID=1872648 RepID=UPI0039E2D30B
MSYSTHHHHFTIKRDFDAPPALAFLAWADPDAKAAWFRGPNDWQLLERHFDFREGGTERVKGRFPSGQVSDFHCRYSDIVPDQRIVYTYDMYVNDKRISVSVVTVEFTPAAGGTHLELTEQVTHLDGYPTPEDRERGTAWGIDNAIAYIISQKSEV